MGSISVKAMMAVESRSPGQFQVAGAAQRDRVYTALHLLTTEPPFLIRNSHSPTRDLQFPARELYFRKRILSLPAGKPWDGSGLNRILRIKHGRPLGLMTYVCGSRTPAPRMLRTYAGACCVWLCIHRTYAEATAPHGADTARTPAFAGTYTMNSRGLARIA